MNLEVKSNIILIVMTRILVLFALLFFTRLTHASVDTTSNQKKKYQSGENYVGLGLGLNYGGIGINYQYYVIEQLSLFGGMGSNLVSIGWNAGAKIRVIGKRKLSPFIIGMYGYNFATGSKNSQGSVYYGPTFGGGTEIYLNKARATHLELGVLYPIRSAEAESIVGSTYPRVLFFIGFHF